MYVLQVDYYISVLVSTGVCLLSSRRQRGDLTGEVPGAGNSPGEHYGYYHTETHYWLGVVLRREQQ